MARCNIQNIQEINRRFERSWERISNTVAKNKIGTATSDQQVTQLRHCLKWCVAYALLHSYCKEIIQPYSDRPALVIKRFWVDYWEQHETHQPPTAKDFFEWYCDSDTILQERSVKLLIL